MVLCTQCGLNIFNFTKFLSEELFSSAALVGGAKNWRRINNPIRILNREVSGWPLWPIRKPDRSSQAALMTGASRFPVQHSRMKRLMGHVPHLSKKAHGEKLVCQTNPPLFISLPECHPPGLNLKHYFLSSILKMNYTVTWRICLLTIYLVQESQRMSNM